MILRRQTENGETLSPGIRVGEALIPISRAKVVTGRSGCWIGRQGEYFFIPATLDVGWLRNFFRTGEQTATGRLSENWFVNGGFPVPVVPVKSFELRTPRCRALLGGGFDAEGRFRLRLHYLYEGASVAAGSGRLVRLGGEYALRDECAELKLERELEMFGFRREGGFLTLAETEAAGIFVDQVLARWIALRGDLCLEAPLARLCAGGRGVPPVELRCQVRERGEEGWLIRYDLTAAGMLPTFAAVAAAVRSGAMYLSGEGALARIPPELGRCIRGLGNISLISPWPFVMRVRISFMRVVPSRHGVHLPQDSSQMKFMKNWAMLTMQLSSSMTTRPPEPMIAPTFFRESKSIGRSRCSSVRHPPDGPPIWTALNFLPFLMPPPMS